jgi:predicted nuclease with TOPRIM domain
MVRFMCELSHVVINFKKIRWPHAGFINKKMMKNKKFEEIIKKLNEFREQIEELKDENVEFEETSAKQSINQNKIVPPKLIFSVNDLAEMFQVTPRTIFNWKDQGKLSYEQINSKTYITASQLDDFLKRNEVKSFRIQKS